MIYKSFSHVMADVLFDFSDEKAEGDPRNDDDYDTFEYGTEPLPKDKTWVHKDPDNR